MVSIRIKSKKYILLSIIIVVIWILCLLINYCCVSVKSTFSIKFKEETTKYNDCEIAELYNIGYKIVQYKVHDNIYYSEIVFPNKQISIVPYYKDDLGYYVNNNGIVVKIEDWEMLRHFPVSLKTMKKDEYNYYMKIIYNLENK